MERRDPAKKALTDRSLKALKPAVDGARQVVWDSLMPGMAVRVSAKGKRSFYAVKRLPGAAQPTWHLLGAYPNMTLAEEKRRASEAAARAAAANTFGAVAETFARQYLPRIKSAKVYEAYLRREI